MLKLEKEQIVGQNIKGGINNNGKKNIRSIAYPTFVSRYFDN
jgi:hypothetical protein